MYSFGNNDHGQLGLRNHGPGTGNDKPTLIPGITAQAISAGAFSLLVKQPK